ncbi:glycosyltransferase [Thermodesulfobacteriota bacterium]
MFLPINMDDTPLVTVIQLSYNDEQYVAESLQSIFSQTYHPLQIVISDDGSTDGSISIVERLVSNYSGPHRVVLHRNDKNLGLGDNVSKAMELAEGELIIESDGDDISFSSRVSDTVQAWLASGRKHLVMCGKSLIINERGEPAGVLPRLKPVTIGEVLQSSGELWVQGASLSWHRSVFEIFGPLREGVVAQDRAIGFRSLLLGQQIGYIEKPVIRYRAHSASLTNDRTTQERLADKAAMLDGFVRDFEKARSLGYLDGMEKVDQLYKQFTDVSADFSLREKVFFSGLAKSIFTLLTCGNEVPYGYRRSLLVKRILGQYRK